MKKLITYLRALYYERKAKHLMKKLGKLLEREESETVKSNCFIGLQMR